MNDKIETLALDHGRYVNEWPSDTQRDAVAAVYLLEHGDIFLSEACDELTDTDGETLALLAAYREPNTIMRQALLGQMLDRALLAYGLRHVEAEVDANYESWRAEERQCHAERVYDVSREDFHRDAVEPVVALTRSGT